MLNQSTLVFYFYFFNRNRKEDNINRLCTAIHYNRRRKYNAGRSKLLHIWLVLKVSHKAEHMIVPKLQKMRVVYTLTNWLQSKMQRNITQTKLKQNKQET